jgi:hypothetical protein
MGPNDSVPESMTHHQTKKKRVEDQPPPSDAGQHPIQLQRRRVWRACESCRSVSLLSLDVPMAHNQLVAFPAERRLNVMEVNQLALNALLRDRHAHGYRRRTEPR